MLGTGEGGGVDVSTPRGIYSTEKETDHFKEWQLREMLSI